MDKTSTMTEKNKTTVGKNSIILCEASKNAAKISVRFDGDTVWLNRAQIAQLFGRDIKTVGKHKQQHFSGGHADDCSQQTHRERTDDIIGYEFFGTEKIIRTTDPFSGFPKIV